MGSKEACFKFIKALNVIKNLANLGDVQTLIIHPASTIYRNLTPEQKEETGAFEDLIRVSVGIEHMDDIKQEFEQALNAL